MPYWANLKKFFNKLINQNKMTVKMLIPSQTFLCFSQTTLLKNPLVGAGPNIQADRLIFRQTDSLVLRLPLWLMEFLIESTRFFTVYNVRKVYCMNTNCLCSPPHCQPASAVFSSSAWAWWSLSSFEPRPPRRLSGLCPPRGYFPNSCWILSSCPLLEVEQQEGDPHGWPAVLDL